MFHSAISLLTAGVILGHAVFGCCLPHAHADERGGPPALGSIPIAEGGEHDPTHGGSHHAHVEGDSCTFLGSPKAKVPACEPSGWGPAASGILPAADSQRSHAATQSPDLSRSGLPPTLRIQDLTQVWLL